MPILKHIAAIVVALAAAVLIVLLAPRSAAPGSTDYFQRVAATGAQ